MTDLRNALKARGIPSAGLSETVMRNKFESDERLRGDSAASDGPRAFSLLWVGYARPLSDNSPQPTYVAKYTRAVADRKKNEKEAAKTAMAKRLDARNVRVLCDVTAPDFDVLFASVFGTDMVEQYTRDVSSDLEFDLSRDVSSDLEF